MYHEKVTSNPEYIHYDFLVVGAGVAGLRAAIELARAGSVLIVAKDSLRESSSEYAQGGIAAALGDDDEVGLHELDTLAAGDGLCDPGAVRTLVEEGPAAIRELIDWGAGFDRDGQRLLFAREGAHSRSRVLHAHGDSTGSEIARTLYRRAAALPNVAFRSFSAITDLLLAGGEVAGAVACDASRHCAVHIRARAVLMATGGLGRLYRDTTNPDVATGDGVSVAWRAGAVISDIEFVQFHPTALHLEGAPRFLLSEALRGEGGFLRNAAGRRFMPASHPMAELAPRDVVSRSIVVETRRTGAPHVFLDLAHLPPGFVPARFPRIYQTCLRYGIDLERRPAPVYPAAHYAMGGIRTGLDGRSSLPRLFAAGEVACTGVHGANRLASNSLLEGVVFGRRAGAVMKEVSRSPSGPAEAPEADSFPAISEDQIRELASRECGILRSGDGLRRAVRRLESITGMPFSDADRRRHEIRNMFALLSLIARCALARQESRGAHFRADFPDKRPEFAKHSLISKPGNGVAFA